MTAPAAFSETVAFDSAISLGPSFAFETVILNDSESDAPEVSVDVTVTDTLGSPSWSRLTPSLSFSCPPTTSKRSSETE